MKNITLSDYEIMLRKHDWYYFYSDDYRVRKSGEKNQQKLIKIAETQSDVYFQLYLKIKKEKFK